MKVRGKLFMVAVLVAFMAAGSAFAQTVKGTIQGRVVDESGNPLPGVSVTLTSPAMQGKRMTTTDKNGEFRFSLLPPGVYEATFELDQFQTMKNENIKVGIGQTITLAAVTMKPAFGEEVVVTSTAPVVDVTSTTVGANLSQEVIVDLPTGRTYQALSFLAPGAVDGGIGGNPSIMGSSSAENRYVVDELDTTDPAFGTTGTNISFNFIQEVRVQTGGYEAEYGGALGGVINMITKSGSNEFHGEVFAYYTDDSFAAEAKTPATRGAALTEYTEWDVGFDVGGKIIKDKLWYFIAYNPNFRDNTYVNDVYGVQTNVMKPSVTAQYYAGKLTWQATEKYSVTATVIGDPTDIDDDYYTSFFVNTSYLPTDMIYDDSESGGLNYGVTLSGIPSESVLFEIKVGHHETKEEFTPRSDLPHYEDGTTDGIWTGVGHRVRFGGPGFQQIDGDRWRDQLRATVTWFAGEQHEIKVGAQWNWVEFDDVAGVVGSSESFCAPLIPGAVTYDWHVGDYVELTADNEEQLNGLGIYFCDPGTGDPYGGILMPARRGNRLRMRNWGWYNSNYKQDSHGETDEAAIFVQDKWKITDYLTINLGVRAESTEVMGDASKLLENRGIDLSFQDTIQPRVGFIWDWAKNGRSKLYGHYGKFYESIPLDINVRAFGNENYDFYFYFYPDEGLPTVNNAAAGFGNNPGYLFYILKAGGGTAADPNLDGQYLEEYVLGTEYEIQENLAVGVKGIYRRLGRVIEDISVDGGNSYFITNPGGWYYENPVTGIPLDEPVYFPKPSRIYRAIELSLNKRYSDNWQLYASLLWSRNKGNYGGLFRQDNGQLDPNITSLYDLPDLLNGAYGLLPNDRKWQFKAYGSYHWDFGLITGFNFTWMTGTPLSKMGAHSTYGPNERFVEPRGTAGRTPTIRNLDLHLSYPFKMASPFSDGDLEFELMLDVFNVFNEQKPTVLDQEWTIYDEVDIQRDEDNDGWPDLDTNHDGVVDADEQKTNDSWGAPLAYQRPRNYRVGIKISW